MPKSTLTMTTSFPDGTTVTLPISIEGPKHDVGPLASHFAQAVADMPKRFSKPGGGIKVSFHGTDKKQLHTVETDKANYPHLSSYIATCNAEALAAFLATLP